MSTNAAARWVGITLIAVALAACGGGGGDDTSGAATLGPFGGTVGQAGGAQVEVPAGALTQNTAIAVAQASAGAPALPAGVTAFGPMVAFTPHGTTFAVPVTITVPFDAAAVPAGTRVALYKTTAGETAWERVAGATVGASSVTALIESFSFAQVVLEPLFRGDPVREWTFSDFQGRAMTVTEFDSGRQEGGVFERFVGFGGAAAGGVLLDHVNESIDGTVIAQDGIADGQVFSSADGVTYGAFAEAPIGNPGLADSPAGGRALLRQFQAFIKRSPNATLQFTLSRAFIDLRDDNGGFNSIATFTQFPGKCVYPPGQLDALDACQDVVRGQLTLAVKAYTHATSASTPGRTFFHTAGVATALGHTGQFESSAVSSMLSTIPLWSPDDFQPDLLFIGGAAVFNGFLFEFKGPRTYTVDLSSIPEGAEFTLRSEVLAEATNRQGDKFAGIREKASAAAAFLRDPLSVGGTTVEFTGLEPIANPVTEAPPDVPVTPAGCAAPGGTDPQAGTIQFSAAAYTIEGHGSATQPVLITRSGGSRGAVTATFTTSDGSALAGTDYTAVSASVFFADGDANDRLAEIPLIRNLIDGEPDKTVNLRLTNPGNCATLGVQSSAVLTLLDNKAPPPPLASGLDLGFGVDGKAAMPETGTPKRGFGGDRSAMAVQADGKIVMVGGTFTDFILARFNADGSLDTTFGIDGKVTTDMGGGPFEQEEALGVAIQADGKIVVVGHTSIPTSPPAPNLPPTFALARYDGTGILDANFGSGGRVSANVNGIARAVAIQPDGKIVVAGDVSFPSSNGSDFSDFTVARFNSNGTLDLGFGGSGTGQVATDIGSSTNSAGNIVLQPNGAIVVSGKPLGDQPGFDHTDVARYTANGVLDAGFGSGGKLTIAGADVGQGLVRQADGRLVLVGRVVDPVAPATSRFLLKRLNVDGTPDTGFGSAGTVDSTFTQNATAASVALQADGKIVVVGSNAFTSNPNFLVARYGADGSVDLGFGIGGTVSIDFFGFSDGGENVLVQSDGKILVSGVMTNNFAGYGLARINP